MPGFVLEQGNREESGIGCHLGIRLGDGTRKEMKGLLPCGPWPSVAEREREGKVGHARAGLVAGLRPGSWLGRARGKPGAVLAGLRPSSRGFSVFIFIFFNFLFKEKCEHR